MERLRKSDYSTRDEIRVDKTLPGSEGKTGDTPTSCFFTSGLKVPHKSHICVPGWSKLVL